MTPIELKVVQDAIYWLKKGDSDVALALLQAGIKAQKPPELLEPIADAIRGAVADTWAAAADEIHAEAEMERAYIGEVDCARYAHELLAELAVKVRARAKEAL